MNLFLIRHAQSQANVNPSILQTITNQKIELTNIGVSQAEQTGKYLSEYSFNKENIIIWHSPYTRTRQTADIIYKKMISSGNFLKIEKKESLYICERQLGILEVVENFSNKFPEEKKYYDFYKNQEDDFFITPHMGESPFQLCLRVNIFLEQIKKDTKNTHLIISHGACIRAMNLMYRNLSYENYTVSNPLNCSVNLLNNNEFTNIFSPNPKTS